MPFENRRPNIHSLSAAAIDVVEIKAGRERAVTIEIAMNNSAGIFQVDELLATKLRGSGLEEHLEVVARIDAEHEKRLVPGVPDLRHGTGLTVRTWCAATPGPDSVVGS